jgi:hypothetical protein
MHPKTPIIGQLPSVDYYYGALGRQAAGLELLGHQLVQQRLVVSP